MAGKIIADTLEHSTAGSVTTDYVVNGSAKAWIIFAMGSGSIGNSLNFSSISDAGTGFYDCSFSASFDSVNYALTGGGSDEGSGPVVFVKHGNTQASQVRVYAINRTGTAVDSSHAEIANHGDLA